MLSSISSLFHNKSAQPVLNKSSQPVLDDCKINENNFVIIRLWKPKVNGVISSYPRAALCETFDWLIHKRAVIGHISIEIFIENFPSIYKSHWPDKEKLKNFDIGNPHVGKNNSLKDDIESEGQPDDYIILYGVDVHMIKAAADSIGDTCRWTLKGEKSDFISSIKGNAPKETSYSCSRYVYKLLEDGRIFQNILKNTLPDNKYLNAITPIQAANLANKAAEVERKMYPKIQLFIKDQKRIKEKVLSDCRGDKPSACTIDYATIYNKNNPEDNIFNQITSKLNEFHTTQLLEYVKIPSDGLVPNLKKSCEGRMVELIEKGGANPSTIDINGKNTLYYAIVNRYYDCIKFILNLYPNLANSSTDLSADVNQSDPQCQQNHLTLYSHVRPKNTARHVTMLDLAKGLGDAELESLLIKYGAQSKMCSR